MTTADVSLVAKESIVVEKLKNYMPAQFFCPILYILHTTRALKQLIDLQLIAINCQLIDLQLK